MSISRARTLIAAGLIVAVGAVLILSISAPSITLGQETDVPVDDGNNPPASIPDDDVDAGLNEPDPAALPDAGTGASDGTDSGQALVIVGLAAAGGVLAGTGLTLARRRRTVGSR